MILPVESPTATILSCGQNARDVIVFVWFMRMKSEMPHLLLYFPFDEIGQIVNELRSNAPKKAPLGLLTNFGANDVFRIFSITFFLEIEKDQILPPPYFF